MMSVCCPHPEPFFPTLFIDADTDTDDMNSPNLYELVRFLLGCGNADPDTETWNNGIRHGQVHV